MAAPPYSQTLQGISSTKENGKIYICNKTRQKQDKKTPGFTVSEEWVTGGLNPCKRGQYTGGQEPVAGEICSLYG